MILGRGCDPQNAGIRWKPSSRGRPPAADAGGRHNRLAGLGLPVALAALGSLLRVAELVPSLLGDRQLRVLILDRLEAHLILFCGNVLVSG